jgi:hypothetical protein
MPRHGQSPERYPVNRLSTYTAIQFGSCEVLKILMSSLENFWREGRRAFAIGEHDRMENR